MRLPPADLEVVKVASGVSKSLSNSARLTSPSGSGVSSQWPVSTSALTVYSLCIGQSSRLMISRRLPQWSSASRRTPAVSGSHDGGPTPFLGDIERFEPRRDTNAIRHLPTFVFQDVGNHYLGAFVCEHARRGGSHAGCSARDDSDLASESHRCSPFS